MKRPAAELRLPAGVVARAVAAALAEDLGEAGDVTTDLVVPSDAVSEAEIVSRKDGVIAGLELAKAAFEAFDPRVEFRARIADGGRVEPGLVVATVKGATRALLTGERTALNFLGHLGGIASLTARYVEAVSGTGARIACTRKTTPGLRALEKYAVRAGGGVNHRFGLYDAVLVKDNHIAAAGGIAAALTRVFAQRGHLLKVEVEVDSVEQLEKALAFPIDAVLLDNMDAKALAEAVRIVGGRVLTEASGGVSLENVRETAETGVDLISIGALTHSTPSLDLGLDWRR